MWAEVHHCGQYNWPGDKVYEVCLRSICHRSEAINARNSVLSAVTSTTQSSLPAKEPRAFTGMKLHQIPKALGKRRVRAARCGICGLKHKRKEDSWSKCNRYAVQQTPLLVS